MCCGTDIPAIDDGIAQISADAGPDSDWAILMARAQDGDATAYLALLREITPYLRSLASRWHTDRRDAEDAVQDILLSLDAVRRTYDPSCPFVSWLDSLAKHRAVNRRRQRPRETPRAAGHGGLPMWTVWLKFAMHRFLNRFLKRRAAWRDGQLTYPISSDHSPP